MDADRFGFLAGLGAYTFYTYILFLGFCGIVVLLFFTGFLRPRNSILMGVGFVVGFLPWVCVLFLPVQAVSF